MDLVEEDLRDAEMVGQRARDLGANMLAHRVCGAELHESLSDRYREAAECSL